MSTAQFVWKTKTDEQPLSHQPGCPKSRAQPVNHQIYEEVGLLPSPGRAENVYRLYSPDDLARLQLAKRAKFLGLSLNEIRDTATYAMDGRCGPLQHHLSSLLEAKIADLDERSI
jgi:DNA-binding transcriptional MerR regulator